MLLINLWSPTVMLEKTLESPLDCKEIQPVHPKGDQSWVFIGRSDVEAETPILWSPDVKNWLIWKNPDVGGGLKAGREGDDRGWDGWMASPIQWTWVWVNSASWCWTGRPGELWFRGSQRVRHDWATELILPGALAKQVFIFFWFSFCHLFHKLNSNFPLFGQFMFLEFFYF